MFQPTTFGNYFLTRRLAVGGMAEVYAAKLYGADGFEKDIVIKQILPQYARDPEFVQSFVAEAKIAVTLTHANIVGIYELGRVDGTYFIAMEYVDGLDVFSLIEAAKRHDEVITPGMALYVTEEVAKGLDYAHRKLGPDGKSLGLVHRDLSPRNVLISREGDVKILDFGIAKTRSGLEASMPKTRAGVVKGTSGYMSPEQAVGDEVDPRTDVYQAGLLLFELLTGRALFWRPDDEETRDLMRRHEIIPPSRFSPFVPEELDEIIYASLARNRDQRIQTAADLATILARVRVQLYPDVTLRSLGELTSRLLSLEEQQNEEAERSLPSTAEVVRTIDALKTPEARARVETLAARPATPPAATGLAPVPSPVLPRLPSMGARSPLSLGSGEPKSRWRGVAMAGAMMGLGALAIAGAFAWPTRAATNVQEAPRAVPDPPESRESAGLEAEMRIEPAVVDAARATGPTIQEPHEKDPPPKRISPPPQRDPAPRGEAFATVAFGTRSCSSRVSVDGTIVARSTPFYDFKLPAGVHRIMIEGTSCPPVERPGSLRATLPSVSQDVQVDGGSRVKIIADFEQDRLLVRK